MKRARRISDGLEGSGWRAACLRHPDHQPHVNVLPPARRTVVVHVMMAAAVHGTRSLVGQGAGVKFGVLAAENCALRRASLPRSSRRNGRRATEYCNFLGKLRVPRDFRMARCLYPQKLSCSVALRLLRELRGERTSMARVSAPAFTVQDEGGDPSIAPLAPLHFRGEGSPPF
jgi:hypothetical protein